MHQVKIFLILCICVIEGHSTSSYNYNLPDHEYEDTGYSFSYGVKDPHTGDVKHQWEKKVGNTVQGQYSVLQPDGITRTVDYTVDGKNGFQAEIHNHPRTSTVLYPPLDSYYTSVKSSVKTEYEYEDGTNEVKHYVHVPKTTLPVDVKLVKGEVIVPVDVSKVQPVEIDLGHQTQELSSEQLKQFLKEYYDAKTPKIESGFKPLSSPGTYAGKNPVTTPGLKNFASRNRHRFRVPPKRPIILRRYEI